MRTFNRKKGQRLRARNAEKAMQKLKELRLLDELEELRNVMLALRNKLKELDKDILRATEKLTTRTTEKLMTFIRAFTEPLTRYWEWKNEELTGLKWPEKEAFQGDLILFWIHWLECIEIKFRRFVEFEPIRDLRRLLEDLRNGERSELTDQLSETSKEARKRGDQALVAKYKEGIADSYKLLTVVGFCSRKRAILIIERCAKERGLKIMSGIPDLARPSEESRLGKDMGITLFLDELLDLLEKFDVRTEFIEHAKDVLKGYEKERLYPSHWKGIVRDFIAKNWQAMDIHSRIVLRRCWVKAREQSCDIILRYSARKDELRRYGYVRQA